MKEEKPEENKLLGEKGELKSISFLKNKNWGVTTQRADLIGYLSHDEDREVCGEWIKSDEAIRIEVRTRSRLMNPPPYWAVGLEEKDLLKYEKFYERTKMKTLIVVPVLDDENSPEGIFGAFFLQWLHVLLRVPKDKFFYRAGRAGQFKNINVEQFKYKIFGENLSLVLKSLMLKDEDN